MKDNSYYVYILTNLSKKSLYIGVTNDLSRRIIEHKEGLVEGFTKRYKIKILIYCEEFSDINEARSREKQLKNWHREWKLNLIKKVNPELEELVL